MGWESPAAGRASPLPDSIVMAVSRADGALLRWGEPKYAAGAGSGALVVGDALHPETANGVTGGDEGEERFIQGAQAGVGLHEGFRQGVGGEPAGEGFGGCGDLLCAGEVELGDSGELRWG